MALRRNAKLDLLKRVPVFEHCSRRQLQEVARIADELDFPEGKELTKEGAPGREFFVIVEGEVGVAKGGEEIRTLSSGDFFGEIGLLEDVPRTATVTAKTPVRYFVLTRRSFRSLLERQPEIERKVMRAFADRVRPAITRDPTTA